MYKNDKEMQRNRLIGEAVYEMLDENSLITNALLVTKLQGYLCANVESLRKEAIDDAITMIMASDSPYNRTYSIQ